MEKTYLKIFLIAALVFSLFGGVKAYAQNNDIFVETTGYSILSASSIVFEGYYDGNFDKKGFTTYFEFKKDDSNLDSDTETTIPIVRKTNVGEYGYFYTSPELNPFSVYYFRAVGYLNDNPSEKFYGNILRFDAGYVPFGMSFPLSVTYDYQVVDYHIPKACDFLGSLVSAICQTQKSPSCPASQEIKDGVCKDKVLSCPEGQELKNGVCVKKIPVSDSALNPPRSSTSSEGGLVPCGTLQDGKITNPCDFDDILNLINRVVKFIFIDLVIPIAAIMFAYAGFELLTSGGSTEKKSKAKSIFINVAIGLAIAAAAFLIVQTILGIVGAKLDIGINWFGLYK